MLQAKKQSPLPMSAVSRAEQIQRQLEDASGRDLQLWSIVILTMVVLVAGALGMLVPKAWSEQAIPIERNYLYQLYFGAIATIVLFNIYLIAQKRVISASRRVLVAEVVLNEQLESLSFIDPLTHLFNRRAVNELLAHEIARCNQHGTALTLMGIDLSGFRRINEKFGNAEGDHLLIEFARLLKTVFRGGDVLFRHGGDEFLIAMPDTTEQQADPPVQRLLRLAEQWNLNSKAEYELTFSWVVLPYVVGGDPTDILRAIDRRLCQKKHKLIPVF